MQTHPSHSQNVLVTGGAGYIGSHTCLQLIKNGYTPIILDNLSVSSQNLKFLLDRYGTKFHFYEGEIQNNALINEILSAHNPIAAIHFAGKINVAESVANPQKYWLHNVEHSQDFLSELNKDPLKKIPIVFSSSAAVYGNPSLIPIDEDQELLPISPYGETKLAIERELEKQRKAKNIPYIALRYFNAAGADPDGGLGELHEPETHLIPLLLRADKDTPFKLFGTSYPTPDGTCIRDYIHVNDLATAHILAIESLLKNEPSGCINLGNGQGYSNLKIIQTVEKVKGSAVPYTVFPPRKGDPPSLIANTNKAKKQLNWSSHYTDIEDIIRHAWDFEKQSYVQKQK